MPTVAGVLEQDGSAILRAALRALYRADEPGWFASTEADTPTRRWLTLVAGGARGGDYPVAISATRSLEHQAAIGGATLLECHQFLGYFRAALIQVLARRGTGRDETAAAHRLMACFEQRLLDGPSGDALRTA
jgi:hypothetical protein